MNRKPIPYSPFSFPFSSFGGEEDKLLQHFHEASGLTVSEDEKNIYIEAAVPGIKAEEIEVNFDQGVLWIRGEKKEETEDKRKKYYRKASNTFSYRVAIPGSVDETKQPEAVCKHGVLKVTFAKRRDKEGKSKRISIKNG